MGALVFLFDSIPFNAAIGIHSLWVEVLPLFICISVCRIISNILSVHRWASKPLIVHCFSQMANMRHLL